MAIEAYTLFENIEWCNNYSIVFFSIINGW